MLVRARVGVGKLLKISRRCRNPDRKGWQGWGKGGIAANPEESEAWLWVPKTSVWGYGMTRSREDREVTDAELGQSPLSALS